MDPLSVSASVTALVSTSLATIRQITDFLSRDLPASVEPPKKILDDLKACHVMLETGLNPARGQVFSVNALALVTSATTAVIPTLEQLSTYIAKNQNPSRNKVLRIMRSKSTISELQSHISAMKNTLTLYLQTVQLLDLRAIGRETSKLNNPIDDKFHGIDKSRLSSWMASWPFHQKHLQVLKTYVAGTGDWFFQEQIFREWRRGKGKQTLFLSGQPGSGKTTIMCQLIQWIQSNSREKQGVAYFYFDNTTNPTPYQALGSIICQLYLQCELAIPKIVQRWVKGDGKDAENLDPADQDDLWAAFSRLVPEFGSVTICIDALDECADRKSLVQLLDKLKRLSCRIAVASRSQNWLEPVAKEAYKLSMDRENQEDIRQYVRAFLGGKPKLADIMDEPLKRNIESAVTEKAAGMFLWAKLALDGILQQTTTSELKQYIQDLPSGLSSTTDLILDKIASQPPNRAELARRVLTWLSYAKRPLTLSEIREAAGITPDSAIIDIEKMAPAWAIEETCMGLVVVDPDTDRVQLVHNTIAEYLCDSKEKLFPRGNEAVANWCLSYLQSENLSLDPQKDRKSIRDQPFAVYASGYWGFHVRECWKDTGVLPRALELLNQPQLLKALVDLARYSKPTRDGTCGQLESEIFGMLHIAAYFDLVELTMPYLEHIPWDITATDSEGRTPLHIASERGHLDSCNALLHKGADINHKDTGGQTPLSYAVAGNHPEVVRTLCEAGAESNGRINASSDWTLMDHAAANGFTKVVEVLLSVRTPTLGRFVGGDSLCLAAGAGNFEIVKLLLEHAVDHNEDQALLRAAKNGSKDIVLLLYEHGADMRATDAEGMTPLHLAAAYNHVDLMKVIISEGSSLDQTDRRGRTALFLASENGCEKAIRLLVERGARIESLDKLGCTPLTLSAENGHSEILRFLLDHSARSNSNASSNSSKTSDSNQRPHLGPLQIACRQGHISVVRTLLEKQWDPEDQGQVGRTPLSYASEGGHSAIVDLLLKNPIVDVNATDGENRTPLSYAAALGHSDVVLKLVELPQTKADIADHRKRTPLSYAAENGHTDTVKILLRSSTANLLGSDDSGLSPLDYAANFNHAEIEKMLENHESMLSPV